jgi:enamine deaminase RidA (YjgF/YER057c/UK114 family)
MKRRLINPPGTERIYERWKFSQAVRVGDTVWVSGQVGAGSDGIPEKIEDQARIAFESLSRVLEAAGASLADVVELVTYHTDMSEQAGVSSVKSEFFPKDYPAWTAVGVTGLALPELRLEVKATAVIGSAEVER